jgi:hypothetical protein
LSIKDSTSVTSNSLRDVLMFLEEKMLKVKQSKFTTDTTELTRDGMFFILTRNLHLRLRD